MYHWQLSINGQPKSVNLYPKKLTIIGLTGNFYPVTFSLLNHTLYGKYGTSYGTDEFKVHRFMSKKFHQDDKCLYTIDKYLSTHQMTPFPCIVTYWENFAFLLTCRPCLLNHSCQPNCFYVFDGLKMIVRTAQDVEPGQQVRILYSFTRYSNTVTFSPSIYCNREHHLLQWRRNRGVWGDFGRPTF